MQIRLKRQISNISLSQYYVTTNLATWFHFNIRNKENWIFSEIIHMHIYAKITASYFISCFSQKRLITGGTYIYAKKILDVV
jgi:hypothetical protein